MRRLYACQHDVLPRVVRAASRSPGVRVRRIAAMSNPRLGSVIFAAHGLVRCAFAADAGATARETGSEDAAVVQRLAQDVVVELGGDVLRLPCVATWRGEGAPWHSVGATPIDRAPAPCRSNRDRVGFKPDPRMHKSPIYLNNVWILIVSIA